VRRMAGFVETEARGVSGMPLLALEGDGEAFSAPMGGGCCCTGLCMSCPACSCEPMLPPLAPCHREEGRGPVVKIKSVALVFNPMGGNASRAARLQAVEVVSRELRAGGVTVTRIDTRYAGNATLIVNQLPLTAPTPLGDEAPPKIFPGRTSSSLPWTDEADELIRSSGPFDCIIIGGGDGTLREGVAGMEAREDGAASCVPVITIPIGTGNSTAIDFGIRTAADTIRAVLGGRTHFVDGFECIHAGKDGADPSGEGHSLAITAEQADPETGVIARPGRVFGINVFCALAPSDATMFAEANRWLGGLRYDAGGMMTLVYRKKQFFSVHASQQRLDATFPLREPGGTVPGTPEEEPAADEVRGAAATGSSKEPVLAVAKPTAVRGIPESEPDVFAIFLQNTRMSGKELHVCPSAFLDDGLLDVMLTERSSRCTLFRMFNLLKGGGGHVGYPGTQMFRVRSMLISHDNDHIPGLSTSASSRPAGGRAAPIAPSKEEAAIAARTRSSSTSEAGKGVPLIVMIDGDIRMHTPVLVRVVPRAWVALIA
jgi:diacylglycerol kinase family enzyme